MSKLHDQRTDRPAKSRKTLAMAAAATIGLLTAGACSTSSDSSTPTSRAPTATPNLQLASALLTFDSCDGVLQNIKTEAGKRITPYGLQTANGRTSTSTVDTATADVLPPSQRPVPTTTAPASAPSRGGAEGGASRADKSAEAPAAPAAAGANQGEADAAAPAHSNTNVQEAGVDEPDLVKTDGKRMFVLLGGTLRSFTIVDGNPKPAGELNLRGSSGNGEQQLLMSGDKLLVLTKGVATTVNAGGRRPAVIEEDVEDGGTSPSLVGTQLVEVDASDPANMKQTSQITIDGNVVDARLVGSTARVVLESSPGALSFVRPTSSSKRAQDSAKAANQRIITESTTSDWLPQYTIQGSTERRPLVECAGVSRPQQFGGFGMVTVLTVEIGKGINPRNSVAVQADADKVYATKDRLFVSTNRLPDAASGSTTTGATSSAGGGVRSEAPVTTGTRPGIDCDPACPAPQQPTTTRVSPSTPEIKTSIHEFDITGNGPAVYRASGEVRGHLMNDFAMSSRDGFLRVATTDTSSRSSRGGTESFVSVLHEEGGELKVVGQVGGMGKGEQIKSVRFMDSIGYVVTFRQTDPLYTIDVSNPRDPKIAGELKILGYSAYLHPVAPGRLLGVGQDATSTGRAIGTQVSLFDVSNAAEPTELQKITLPNASSDAEQDYHAFLWWDPTNLAMIPVQSSGRNSGPVPAGACPPDATCTSTTGSPTPPFVGAIGFTVDASGIKELGQIVNPSSGTSVCPPDAEECDEPVPPRVPGPTVTTVPTPPTTLPNDPAVLEACRAAGQCPPAAEETGSEGGRRPGPSTTVVCVTDPCPGGGGGEPLPPTTSTSIVCESAPCNSSTTSTSTSSTTPSSSTSSSSSSTSSSTSTTTKPSNGCDPLCPMPTIIGTGSQIERAIVVGDRVYTVSTTGIVVSELSTLKSLGWVPFR